ncbi:MAG: phosphate ABC transporter substrate-binding protein [Chloroflexi bacterium]|nr:phosphate ABC transporter substrate-binding protein [Chloroflexota bacterium]
MNKSSRLSITIISMLVLAMVLVACGMKTTPVAENAPLKGNITISGAWALYPMMTVWAEEYAKINPEVQFDVSAGGAGKGMADALAGAVDIGMVSRDISAEEEAKGAYWIGVVKDAVFPTISINNPVLADLTAKGLTQETLIKIYITGEIKTWGEAVGKPEITDEIHVYTRSDSCGAAETWAKFLGNKKQEDLLGIGVYGDPGLLDAVIKDPLGIGFNNLGYAYDSKSNKPVEGSTTVPIDVNNNGVVEAEELLETKEEASQMVAEGKYPSPPARVLNLVTNGKPSGLVQAFILWTLTDGQKFVGDAGFIQLTSDQLEASLNKIR